MFSPSSPRIPPTPARSTSHIIKDKNPLQIIEALVSGEDLFSGGANYHHQQNHKNKSSSRPNTTSRGEYAWGKKHIIIRNNENRSSTSRSRSRSRSPPFAEATDPDGTSNGNNSPRSRSRSPPVDYDESMNKNSSRFPAIVPYYEVAKNKKKPSTPAAGAARFNRNNNNNTFSRQHGIGGGENDDDNEEVDILNAPTTSAYRTLFFGTANVIEQEAMIAEMMETGKLKGLRTHNNSNNEDVNNNNNNNLEGSYHHNSNQQSVQQPNLLHPNHPRYRSRYHVAAEVPIKPPPNQKSHQIIRDVFVKRTRPFSPIRNENQRKEMYYCYSGGVGDETTTTRTTSRAQTARSANNNNNNNNNNSLGSVMINKRTRLPTDEEREANSFFSDELRVKRNTYDNNYYQSATNLEVDDYEDPVEAFMDKGEPRSAEVRTTSRGTARFWPVPPEPVKPQFCEIIPPRTFIVNEASLHVAAMKARREEQMKNSMSTNRARRFELPKSIEDAAKRAIWMAKQAERAEAHQKEVEEELKERENAEKKRKRDRLRREKRMRAALGKRV